MMTSVWCGFGYLIIIIFSKAQVRESTADAGKINDDTEEGNVFRGDNASMNQDNNNTSNATKEHLEDKKATESTRLWTTLAVVEPVDKHVNVGSVVTMRYTVDFKNYTGPGDSTTIILVTSSDDELVTFRKIVNVSVGAFLLISNPGWEDNPNTSPDFKDGESKDGAVLGTHIGFSLGTVNKKTTASDIDSEEFKLTILYELNCVASSTFALRREVTTSARINIDSIAISAEEVLHVNGIKPTFKLYPPDKSDLIDGGYPVFAHLAFYTLPGSHMTYNISLKTWIDDPSIQYPPMNILTANVIKLGTNIRDAKDTTVKTRLSSSLNSSRFNDVGQLNVTLHNNAANAKVDANTCKLELVLIRPNISSKYKLRAELNRLGYQEIVIEGKTSSDYKDWIKDANIRTLCRTSTYHFGMSTQLKIIVSTSPNTTAGPLQIFLPTSPGYRFISAKVGSVGRNVVCVNPGLLEAREQIDGAVSGTMLDLPFLCNRKRYDGPAENEFIIFLKVNIIDANLSATNEGAMPVFNATLSAISKLHVKHLSQTFRTVATKDLGSVTIVKQIQLDPTLTLKESDGQNSLKRWLSISVEHTYFYNRLIQFDSIQKVQTDGVVQWIWSPNDPVVGRYIRISYKSEHACHTNFTVTTSDDNMPILHGSDHRLNNILRVFNEGTPQLCSTLWRGVPHVWLDVNTSLYNIDESRPFTVMLEGYGLQCNSTVGPQVTMVVFAKHGDGLEGENHHRVCEFVDEVKGSATLSSSTHGTCQFYCDCSGHSECRRFTMLIMHVENHVGPSFDEQICRIRASQASE